MFRDLMDCGQELFTRQFVLFLVLHSLLTVGMIVNGV